MEGGKAGGRQTGSKDVLTSSQGLLSHKAPPGGISVLECGRMRWNQQAEKYSPGEAQEQPTAPVIYMPSVAPCSVCFLYSGI